MINSLAYKRIREEVDKKVSAGYKGRPTQLGEEIWGNNKDIQGMICISTACNYACQVWNEMGLKKVIPHSDCYCKYDGAAVAYNLDELKELLGEVWGERYYDCLRKNNELDDSMCMYFLELNRERIGDKVELIDRERAVR